MSTFAKAGRRGGRRDRLGAVGIFALQPRNVPAVGAAPSASPSLSASPSPSPSAAASALGAAAERDVHVAHNGISISYPRLEHEAATEPWTTALARLRDPRRLLYDPVLDDHLFIALASQPLAGRTGPVGGGHPRVDGLRSDVRRSRSTARRACSGGVHVAAVPSTGAAISSRSTCPGTTGSATCTTGPGSSSSWRRSTSARRTPRARRRHRGLTRARPRLASSREEASHPCTTSRAARSPDQRHTQHRAPDGTCTPRSCSASRASPGGAPCCTTSCRRRGPHQVEPGPRIRSSGRRTRRPPPPADEDAARRAEGRRDPGRVPLYFNNDVVFGLVRPAEPMPDDRSTGTAMPTRCSSSTRARGSATRSSGTLPYRPGDYLVLPIGTTWRLDPDAGSAQRILYLEAPSEIEPPKRYRNDYGQLLEHSPVLPARPPRPRVPGAARRRGRLRHPRPLDATGSRPTTSSTTRSTSSAGTATSGRSAFNIANFQPITGRVHQPPPVHQTFQARNFVVCSFVPRKFDYHPLAIPAPYNHSNINSRRGHLLRRRQLHEPARGRHRLVHPPPGRDPARPASGLGRGVDRQGGDRGARGDGRHVPPAARSRKAGRELDDAATRTPGCRQMMRRITPRALRARPGGVPRLTYRGRQPPLSTASRVPPAAAGSTVDRYRHVRRVAPWTGEARLGPPGLLDLDVVPG